MLGIFILSLVALALVLGLVTLIQRDAGYILMAYDSYSVETTLWAGLFALLLCLMLVYWLVKLALKLVYSKRSFSYWLEGRKARRNETRITQGLIQFMEGNWRSSEKTFARDAEKSPTPLLNYLMAARASDAAGDTAASAEYLKQAEAGNPEAHLAIGLTQAEIELGNREYESCLANLNRIREEQPDNVLAMTMQARVYQALNDWGNMEALLPLLRSKKLMNEDRLLELERSTHSYKLEKAATPADVDQAWSAVPKALKKDASVIGAYARSLISVGQEAQAESTLRATLKKNWNKELLVLWGEVRGSDPAKQLSAAESWLKNKPDDADLLQAAGRISVYCDQLEKARTHFSASLAIRPDSAGYAELGRLLSRLGDREQSSLHYEKALGLPALPSA